MFNVILYRGFIIELHSTELYIYLAMTEVHACSRSRMNDHKPALACYIDR
jgi:hypothetical protein